MSEKSFTDLILNAIQESEKRVTGSIDKVAKKADEAKEGVVALSAKTDGMADSMTRHRDDHLLLDQRINKVEQSCEERLTSHEEREKKAWDDFETTLDEKLDKHRKIRIKDKQEQQENLEGLGKSIDNVRSTAEGTQEMFKKYFNRAVGFGIAATFFFIVLPKILPKILEYIQGGQTP